MPDRRSPPPSFDAHRVVPSRTARSTAPHPAAPPAVHGRPVADAEAARLLRTVDALRRLQTTLTGAQRALDAVIAEVASASGRPAGAARSAGPPATPSPGHPVRRTAAALPAAPDVLAEHVRATAVPERAPRR